MTRAQSVTAAPSSLRSEFTPGRTAALLLAIGGPSPCAAHVVSCRRQRRVDRRVETAERRGGCAVPKCASNVRGRVRGTTAARRWQWRMPVEHETTLTFSRESAAVRARGAEAVRSVGVCSRTPGTVSAAARRQHTTHSTLSTRRCGRPLSGRGYSDSAPRPLRRITPARLDPHTRVECPLNTQQRRHDKCPPAPPRTQDSRRDTLARLAGWPRRVRCPAHPHGRHNPLDPPPAARHPVRPQHPATHRLPHSLHRLRRRMRSSHS